MVKLGSTLVEKVERVPSLEDGFDNIPLITPLEVNQLQKPFPEKVTSSAVLPASSNIRLTGLILITLAFLACLLLLVMYKALWYDQLSCPEGFVLKHKHCNPAALEMYYPEQEAASRGSLYTAISHLNQAKKALPELSSPWLPVLNALKKSEEAKGEGNSSQQ
uniref:Calcyon neuron-specific vesicular protein n=1 Tax=Electrophorus electricus TaxID=8005 RepID=A0A4W4HTC1_ELEEL